jgi:hypothetical protein
VSSPVIPVSWGELLDKITILEIKTQRLRTPEARANVKAELRLLRQVAGGAQVPAELRAALLAVNLRLWRTEDLIREKEIAGDFAGNFIALARAVYRDNDERARIKQAVNRLLRSALVAEKQYGAS